MANQEAFTLDSLALNDQTTFAVDQVSWPPPRQRQNWIGAADSEAQLLFRNPLHENRKVTLRVAVLPQASMDLALGKIATVLDKLQKASKYTDGIGLVWTPATATLSCTFDVLSGEITDLPIDWDGGWLALAPTFTVELTCKPYWRGTETLTSTSSSSTPFVAFEVAGVTGDIPALGRLIVTDTATQSRRHVEWGLEGPLTYNSATSLLVDSDDMVTSGFAGAQATTTGAYDPNASGNNSVTLTPIAGATTAMAGTGNLSHVGVFRVKARVQSGSLSNLLRLSWRAGDGPTNHNAWVSPISTAGWQELDLGMMTVPATVLGTQRWTGQVDVQGAASSPGTVALDYLTLIPASDGYGKARGVLADAPGVLSALDDFVGMAEAANLNTRTATLGGTWATSGAATDFTGATSGDFTADQIAQQTPPMVVRSSGLTTWRYAVLGSASFTDMRLTMAVPFRYSGTTGTTSLIARWVDSSNHLRFDLATVSAGVWFLRLVKVIAGVETTLASSSSTSALSTALRLTVFASGRAVGVDTTNGVTVEASDSTLATSGTLASGKPGVGDQGGGTGSNQHYVDDFRVSVPDPEPVALYSGRSLQVRYDDTLRQDSTGTYYGRPQSYRGSRFLLPVGTSRVLVKARRNDVDLALADTVTDATQIQVGWTPRGLAVPR